MAYRLKRKESVQRAVRRLGTERIEHAIRCLESGPVAEAIHGARKEIKKARAVLRLVRPRLGKNAFRRHSKRLRDAAAHLAGPRDAYIKTQALQKLASHFKRELKPTLRRQLGPELRRRSDEAMNEFQSHREASKVTALLDRARAGFKWLEVSGRGWRGIGPGVMRCYRAGRRAYAVARSDPTPENFHAWRKCVKDLWYDMRLLRRTWPEEIEALARELDTLADRLGDDHDLSLLASDVGALPVRGGRMRDLEALRGIIQVRQEELRAAALAVGARFYREKPSTFCERIAGYWKIWRKRKSPKLPARS